MKAVRDAVIIIEHGEGDADEVNLALQVIINAGQWSLQGSYGRAMMGAIEAGQCLLGRNRSADYWGNIIPSRNEVAQGTKGSFDFVAAHVGIERAQVLEEVE